MEKAIRGYEYFREKLLPKYREFYALLAQGQNPDTFFIRCSDSRVCLWKLLGIEPGDGFIAGNPGNIVTPWNTVLGGDQAAIEYAVKVLKVRHIVVFGHTCCGAMNALVNGPESVKEQLPALSNMLCMCRTDHMHPSVLTAGDPEKAQNALTELHVKQQMLNLNTYPFVAAARATGDLQVHGWIFKIADAEVNRYDASTDSFVHLI